MSSNWPTKPLGDLLELVIDHRGKTPKKMGFDDFHQEGYPVLSAKHVKTDELVNLDAMRFANEDMYKKWMKVETQAGDIVLTSEAPMGEVFYLDGETKYVLGQRVFGLRVKKDEINPLYLTAWLTSKRGQERLIARSSGSTVLGIKQSELLKIDVDVPPPSVQEEIAKIRYDLSQKIALNTQTNQTLEQIAQAIFKSWFVDYDPVRAKMAALEEGGTPEAAERAAMRAISAKDNAALERMRRETPEAYARLEQTAALFPSAMEQSELGEVPEGWSVKPLDKIAHYQNGLALQKYRPENEDDFLPVVKIAQLKKGFADGEEKASPNIKPECIIDNGDVVFSWSGSLMVDMWCGGKAALNQHLFKVTSENYPKWLYYFYTKHHLEEFQRIAAAKAVTMGHIKREHLKQALCTVPSEEIIELCCAVLGDNIDKQIVLRLESQNLTEVRDNLLPRLLNGEII